MRRHLPAILAVLAATVAAIALYVMHASAVHAWGRPPSALAKLVPDAAPKNIPAAAFVDDHGQRLSLGTFRGRYVLLNLWATWCAPCVRELPALAKLHEALPGLTIIAVSEGRETAPQTAAFLKAHGAGALHTYLDPDHAFLEALGVFGLPLSVVVDPAGKERARATGPAEWDDPQAIDWLRAATTTPASEHSSPSSG